MEYMITTKQLTKKYKHFTAVNDISLHIRKGSIYGFLGPNGAGKSTTMKMLLGLTAPTAGSFSIDGKTFPNDRISILKEVGSFIEAPSFYANLTGRENLDIICRILGLPQSAVDEALELVGLSDFGSRLAKKYSLGMKQKLGIIQAIMEDPSLLLLDEPFNALDAESVDILRSILLQYKEQGKLIILTSHHQEDIMSVCNQVIHLQDGCILN